MRMIKRTVKWLFCVIAYYSGLTWAFRVLNNFLGRRLTVLLYHRVGEPEFKDKSLIKEMFISQKSFAQQMAYVKKRYRILSIEEVEYYLANGKRFPLNSMLITFDDGYADNYYNAYPILKKLQIRASAFVATDFVGTQRAFWWDEAAKQERQTMLTLSWMEIAEMAANGVAFRPHSKSHRSFLLLAEDEMRDEILGSKEVLEELLPGLKAISFAYPGGDVTPFARNILKNAGFVCAFGTREGINSPGTDRYNLRRKGIWDGAFLSPFGTFSLAMFATEITGLLDIFRLAPVRREDSHWL